MLTMRILLVGLLAVAACCADTRFYVDQRGDFANGNSFGAPGIFEVITAKVVTDAGTGRVEVIKPRDPAKGNGTLILDVNGKGKSAPPSSVLESGVTIIRLTWPDAKSLPDGVKEIVTFFKYTGGPMLLGDQRRFLKKAVVVENGPWVKEFVKSGRNNDAKGRPLLDGSLSAADAKALDISKAQPVAP